MKYLANANISREIDRLSINEYGLPSMVLMERAAYECARVIKSESNKKDTILAVCGRGNNGGDAIAAARILHEYGLKVSIYLTCMESELSEQSAAQYRIALKSGITVADAFEIFKYNIIIDGLYGIGLNRNICGSNAELIDEINNSESRVYAVDIPSGINASTGKIMGKAVKADVTITFGLEKTGIVLYPGNDYAGRVVVANIGFPHAAVDSVNPYEFIYDNSDLRIMPERKKLSNKGTYGKVLVVAGSKGMCGASFLSAKAAYRTGCGLVKILAPEENRSILQCQLPEALLSVYGDNVCDSDDLISNQIDWADSIVVGPGLGQNHTAEFLVKLVIGKAKVPVIIDADAINIIAKMGKYDEVIKADNVIITPHLKEMTRLCDCSIEDIREDIVGTAGRCSSNNIIFALKDARTIVSDGKRKYINISGNNGMATAGSGDVLTGIIASLAAQGMDCYNAASLGVYIHGLAGDLAASEFSKSSMLASDIIESIGSVLKGR